VESRAIQVTSGIGWAMKIFFMKVLCYVFAWACDLMHTLPDRQEERLQEWFIDIIGYHCPFAIWSVQISRRYNLNIWKKRPNEKKTNHSNDDIRVSGV